MTLIKVISAEAEHLLQNMALRLIYSAKTNLLLYIKARCCKTELTTDKIINRARKYFFFLLFL